jgi:hypothetical protein
MDIEAKGYVATPKDVDALTRSLLSAEQALSGGRTTYMRALIATTQKDLGVALRVRTPRKIPRLTPEETLVQMDALTATHERFYAVVLKVCAEDGAKSRELNRRSNFARTALYAVRTWTRAGNDLTALAAGRVTKASLRVTGRKSAKPPSPARLRSRVERDCKRVMASILALAETDRDKARVEVRALLAQLEALEGTATLRRAIRPATGEAQHNGA